MNYEETYRNFDEEYRNFDEEYKKLYAAAQTGMTQAQEVLKLALEALEVATTPLAKDRQEVLRAITAIKQALAQPQEPWCMKMNDCKTKCEDCPDEPPQRTEQEPLIGCVNHDCDKCKAQTQEPVVYQCPRCATSMQVDLTAKAALAQTQEPVAYDKTEMNCFVQDLYDKKMQEGKHGHYETMFHVVHQAIKKVPPQRTERPVDCERCN
jgi:hypothetical protein